MKWFSYSWWKFLFAKPYGEIGRIKTAICRLRNHPAGVWYYNPTGLEPDMHCKNCGDDLS